MRVVRLHARGDIRVHDEAEPSAAEGEALLRVTAIGLCGSDLHWFEEAGIGDARLDHPLVLGHEFGGLVESGPLAGRCVAVEPAISCGSCEFCLEGNPNLCERILFAGHGGVDGALRERMAWPERCLFPLPDGMDGVDGAMLEPLGVAIHSVDLAKLRPGSSVGVFGAGPIGLLTLQVARVAGAGRIVATDVLAHRLEAARAFGADEVVPARHDGSEGLEIWRATGGKGLHVVFEAAGDNAAVEAALEAVRPGGTVVLIGIPGDDRTGFLASTARRKGVTIRLVRRMKHTYPRAIELVRRGRVDVRGLVTHRFSLSRAAEAFAVAQRRDGLKVFLEPN